MKKLMNFRLSEKARAALNRICSERGCSATSAVELALENFTPGSREADPLKDVASEAIGNVTRAFEKRAGSFPVNRQEIKRPDWKK